MLSELLMADVDEMSAAEALRQLSAIRFERRLLSDRDQQLVARLAETCAYGVSEIEGVGAIEVRKGRSRTTWEHEGLAAKVIDANLRRTDGEIPAPFTIAGWLATAGHFDYWRARALRDLGLDPDEWSASRPGRPSVQILNMEGGASA